MDPPINPMLPNVHLGEQPSHEGPLRWTYGCRCGGLYVITEDDMEAGQHLVGCISCSEVLWVGYELAEGGEH